MNGSHAFIFAHAASWSGTAVAVIIGVLLEAEIDVLIFGFLASLTLSYMMAANATQRPFGRGRREEQDYVGVIGVSSAKGLSAG